MKDVLDCSSKMTYVRALFPVLWECTSAKSTLDEEESAFAVSHGVPISVVWGGVGVRES